MVEDSDKGGRLVEIWNGGAGSTTSPAQAEVIPRLVGIGRRRSKNVAYVIWGLPSPLDISVLETAGEGGNTEGQPEMCE